MSYSNGLLPPESSSTTGQRGLPGLPGIGYKLTADGNFDIDKKRLTNLADSINDNDATTKKYVDGENTKQDVAIADKASKSDLDSKLNIDGSNSMTSDLDMNDNKITGLADSVDDNDAVNLKVLKEHTQASHNTSSYNLRNSFTFYDNSDNNIHEKITRF